MGYPALNSITERYNQKMNHETLSIIQSLLRKHRWAALATVQTEGYPFASMIAYAVDRSGLIFHLSRMAWHTKNLLEVPKASLIISEQDDFQNDPQTLARLTLTGETRPIGRDEKGYFELKSQYIQRLPQSEPLFDFPDFVLWHFMPQETRFVGGFAKAHTIRDERTILRFFSAPEEKTDT